MSKSYKLLEQLHQLLPLLQATKTPNPLPSKHALKKGIEQLQATLKAVKELCSCIKNRGQKQGTAKEKVSL